MRVRACSHEYEDAEMLTPRSGSPVTGVDATVIVMVIVELPEVAVVLLQQLGGATATMARQYTQCSRKCRHFLGLLFDGRSAHL